MSEAEGGAEVLSLRVQKDLAIGRGNASICTFCQAPACKKGGSLLQIKVRALIFTTQRKHQSWQAQWDDPKTIRRRCDALQGTWTSPTSEAKHFRSILPKTNCHDFELSLLQARFDDCGQWLIPTIRQLRQPTLIWMNSVACICCSVEPRPAVH
jgi:hypothetical protein